MHSALVLQAWPFPRGIPVELELVVLELLDVVEVLELELLVVEPLEPLVVEELLVVELLELLVVDEPLVVELLELLVVDEVLVAAPPFPLELVAVGVLLELLDVVLAAPPVSAGPVNVKCVVQAPTPTHTLKSAPPSRKNIRIRASPASRSKGDQAPE
jgi:hypothetical protein